MCNALGTSFLFGVKGLELNWEGWLPSSIISTAPLVSNSLKKGWGEHLEPTKTNLIVVPPFPNYLRSKKSRYIFAAMAIL
jgi:hypothetical protein